MAAPDRLRLSLDHIAEALDDLTALTGTLDGAAFPRETLKPDVPPRTNQSAHG